MESLRIDRVRLSAELESFMYTVTHCDPSVRNSVVESYGSRAYEAAQELLKLSIKGGLNA